MNPETRLASVRMPEASCPYCDAIISAAGRPENGTFQHPKPGDSTLCVQCAELSVYSWTLQLVKPSKAYMDSLPVDMLMEISEFKRVLAQVHQSRPELTALVRALNALDIVKAWRRQVRQQCDARNWALLAWLATQEVRRREAFDLSLIRPKGLPILFEEFDRSSVLTMRATFDYAMYRTKS